MSDLSAEAVPVEQSALTNAQLTKELFMLRRFNNELHGQVQNLAGRLSKLDRDVRTLTTRRHH